MVWHLHISETAEKQLSKLDKGIERKIRKYLEEVCELADPADRGHALTGPWAGFHRYRVGQIRIITHIERQIVTVTVVTVDRRDSIY
ncbi:MAG: RelE protein [Comamonadaceae bacterium]|nr:MAG: RelE protein [Comamonadaceae bacterium]